MTKSFSNNSNRRDIAGFVWSSSSYKALQTLCDACMAFVFGDVRSVHVNVDTCSYRRCWYGTLQLDMVDLLKEDRRLGLLKEVCI